MQFRTIFNLTPLTLLGLAWTASAHMTMSKPPPFGHPNNSPLAADGSDFPCKFSASYSADNTPATTFSLGSVQPLDFVGTAVHGGGSCQISITYDKIPTKASTWKVIYSIEGGCPARNVAGNLPADNANLPDPDTYSFTVPSSLPTGNATVGWTWFNNVGNREMYMNCGPITITGGSSKRDEVFDPQNGTELVTRDQAAYEALPNMFVANIGNGCGTVSSTDLIFPDPGSVVDKLAATPHYASPTGKCATAGGPAATPESTPGSTSSAVVASSPAADSPGVFVTAGPDSTSTSTPTTVPTQSSSVPANAPTNPTSTPSPAPAKSPSSAPASQPANGGGALTGPCSPEGEWNCINGGSFQQCASGVWSVEESLAAGTQCTPGQSSAINISARSPKPFRPVRFSKEHLRRQHHQAA
jgi:hypothetical protein